MMIVIFITIFADRAQISNVFQVDDSCCALHAYSLQDFAILAVRYVKNQYLCQVK